MDAIKIWIEKYLFWIRLGLIILAIGGFGWVIHWAYTSIWNSGYNARTAEYAKAAQEAKEKVDQNVGKVEKQNEKNIRKIQELPDNDFIAGPIVSSVLDGMPDPQ